MQTRQEESTTTTTVGNTSCCPSFLLSDLVRRRMETTNRIASLTGNKQTTSGLQQQQQQNILTIYRLLQESIAHMCNAKAQDLSNSSCSSTSHSAYHQYDNLLLPHAQLVCSSLVGCSVDVETGLEHRSGGGKLVEMYGPPHSGKTSVSLSVIALKLIEHCGLDYFIPDNLRDTKHPEDGKEGGSRLSHFAVYVVPLGYNVNQGSGSLQAIAERIAGCFSSLVATNAELASVYRESLCGNDGTSANLDEWIWCAAVKCVESCVNIICPTTNHSSTDLDDVNDNGHCDSSAELSEPYLHQCLRTVEGMELLRKDQYLSQMTIGAGMPGDRRESTMEVQSLSTSCMVIVDSLQAILAHGNFQFNTFNSSFSGTTSSTAVNGLANTSRDVVSTTQTLASSSLSGGAPPTSSSSVSAGNNISYMYLMNRIRRMIISLPRRLTFTHGIECDVVVLNGAVFGSSAGHSNSSTTVNMSKDQFMAKLNTELSNFFHSVRKEAKDRAGSEEEGRNITCRHQQQDVPLYQHSNQTSSSPFIRLAFNRSLIQGGAVRPYGGQAWSTAADVSFVVLPVCIPPLGNNTGTHHAAGTDHEDDDDDVTKTFVSAVYERGVMSYTPHSFYSDFVV